MRKLLLGVLVVVGVSAGACTMKAPPEVSQAVSARGANPSVAPVIVPVVAPMTKEVPVIAAKKDVQSQSKPSRLATLASAAGSLPMISMMRGEDGRISPINMMLKIRSMMPMCAGGNCVTTSSGFERVSGNELARKTTGAAAG